MSDELSFWYKITPVATHVKMSRTVSCCVFTLISCHFIIVPMRKHRHRTAAQHITRSFLWVKWGSAGEMWRGLWETSTSWLPEALQRVDPSISPCKSFHYLPAFTQLSSLTSVTVTPSTSRGRERDSHHTSRRRQRSTATENTLVYPQCTCQNEMESFHRF